MPPKPRTQRVSCPEALARHAGLTIDAVTPYLATHDDDAAVRHCFAVAASLESQVIGEPHVLGQVRASHRIARQAGSCGTEMDGLLDAAYTAAKRGAQRNDGGRATRLDRRRRNPTGARPARRFDPLHRPTVGRGRDGRVGDGKPVGLRTDAAEGRHAATRTRLACGQSPRRPSRAFRDPASTSGRGRHYRLRPWAAANRC